ncbi:hypothetical protein TUN199_06644 [Pyrenophora tritici-repentis]|nr:btb poz protein [Pyrenophora tritici-repentis]KAI0609263.1 btb poz protein [Pyrenophora tritici-repentis]KAI0621353.1 hypothetical protein TUN199_06644 [Pyrenophora tritici-repentis]
MASGSIGHVPAATFAEYVDDLFSTHHGHEAGAPQTLSGDEDKLVMNAPPADASQLELAQQTQAPSRCIALRPALTHRLYSQQLHVRAKAKLQRDRLLSGTMMDIYVGPERRHWSLHQNLLCHHSEALENEIFGATQGSSKKDRLDLPDHDPAGFELLVKWLYQGTLDDVSDIVDANQKYEYAVSCHKLYLLCDRFDMAQLKNVAMDQYRKGLNQAELVPDADEIDQIYRKSPAGSPFRLLMTRIAARQIMDPGSERDVETYRECFDNNPDFAIDLVKAIRSGTGGMLFADPTDTGNGCDYHDHEAGPNCNIKGKGKSKQAKNKAGPSSAKSVPYISSDLPNRRPRPPPQNTPRPPLPRPVRPRDGSGGPLRRRLTSPVISTVGTSREMAVATQSPRPAVALDREKDMQRLRQVTTPERRLPEQTHTNGTGTQESRPAPDESPQSSEDGHLQSQASSVAEDSAALEGGPVQPIQRTPSRRGIWEWGRLSIIGRTPHPEWKGPRRSHGATTNSDSYIGTIYETQDGFSIPSTTATDTNNPQYYQDIIAAKLEGYGLSQVQVVTSPSFSQTKRSSDELVAGSSTSSTPANLAVITEEWTNGDYHTPQPPSKENPSTPETPTPFQRRRDSPTEAERSPTKDAPDVATMESSNALTNGKSATPKSEPKATSGSRRISKYRIALASNFLSPSRGSSAST